MTHGIVGFLRKALASLKAWGAAMDYSATDYTNDRIYQLERAVQQLSARMPPKD